MIRTLTGVALLGALGAVWALLSESDAPHVAPLHVVEAAAEPTAREPSLKGAPRQPVLRAWRPPEEPKDRASRARTHATVPPATLDELTKARGWTASVRAFHGLPACTDEEAAARLVERLDRVEDPVVRQNLLFHLALGVPGGSGRLRELRQRVAPAWSADDDEDALVALAFGGDDGALAELTTLARRPSSAPVHRLLPAMSDLEALGASGGDEARAVLRSHHAIEVLDREPYYKLLAVRVPLVWLDVAAPTPEPSRTRLCELWLDRYPGHPGSDDIALRVARSRLAQGRYLDAARWYGKAAALPDQDRGVRRAAAGGLVALAEVLLDREQVLELADELGDETPQHELLHYIYVRRTAAEVGVREGLDALELAIKRADVPTLEAAWHGWDRSWPARGLDSGRTPLPKGDALRAPPQRGLDATAGQEPLVSQDEHDERLDPSRESVYLHVDAIARQVRRWTILARLEERARHERRYEREDLEYKAAAILYHDRGVFWPVYGWYGSNLGHWLAEAWRHDPAPFQRGAERFMATSQSWQRALAAFGRFLDDNPDSDLADKARFSMGLCWRRLADAAPRHLFTSSELDDARRDEAAAGVIACMGEVARHHPQSPLADDAARAVVYWRTWLDRRARAAQARAARGR